MKALVLVVPHLHLGYLGCYGNAWVQTPHLDRLAAEGIVFDRHIVDCPTADPRSSWTGVYPFHKEQPADRLADHLDRHGIPHAFLVEPVGSKKKHPLERRVKQARQQLEALADQPSWLLWVDLPDLLPPWQVPEEILETYFAEEESDEEEEENEPLVPWLDPPLGTLDLTEQASWDRLQFTYAAVVTHLDEQLGGLLEEVPNDVLVCFTAGCGLPLGEHGIIGVTRPWLHDELVHVPLLMRLPGGAQSGRRVAALTQPVDLMPTLLDFFGVSLPAVDGVSLLPLAAGKVETIRPFAASAMQIGDSIEWAMRTPAWAFLLPVQTPPGDPPRSSQLYVQPDDRWEVNNVVQHHMEEAEQMEQTLRAFVTGTSLLDEPRP